MLNVHWNLASKSILDYRILLPVILLLSFFLRIIFIGNHDFWVDELFSLYYAKDNLPDMLQEVLSIDDHPPTYYILLHYWILLFGESELSLRMPSAIFSTLSVYFTYKIGEILFNRRTAAIAALFLALSEFSIYYAQEARMYSFLAFTSVLSVYFLLDLLKRQTRLSLFNYVWSSTLLVYTHVYGLLIITAENIYIIVSLYIYSNKEVGITLRKWILSQIYILLLSLPWIWFAINRTLTLANEGFFIKTPTLLTIAGTFMTFSGGRIGLLAYSLLMLLGVFSIFIIRNFSFGNKLLNEKLTANEGSHIFLLLLLLFTPILIPFIASQLITPIYTTRGTIAGQFAFYLLIAAGIIHLRMRSIRITALTIALMIPLIQISSRGYVHYHATEFSKLVDYLAMNMEKNDAVALCSHGHLDWPLNHYVRTKNFPRKIIKIRGNTTLPDQFDANQLWLVWRTDYEIQCQLPPAISNQYTHTDNQLESFTNLGLTLLIKK